MWKSAVPVMMLGVLLAGCASSTHVDKKEPRRLVGEGNGVRIDAQILDENMTPNSTVLLNYEITNKRSESIAVAELAPYVTFDEESATLTVRLGSEVPGNEIIPRLVRVAPGETKALSAKVQLRMPFSSQRSSSPRFMQIRLNYLSEVEPFKEYLDIPEVGVRDPASANALFMKWVELNASVETNAVPIRWTRQPAKDPMAP